MQGLLARAGRALRRCKPWMLQHVFQGEKNRLAQVQAQADACAAAHPRAGDSLPTVAMDALSSAAPQTAPSCAACGKKSVNLARCARCRSVQYW